MRISVPLEHRNGTPAVRWRGREVDLAALPERSRARLARFTTPVLVELDIEIDGEHVRAVALGAVRPDPRVAALRALADERFADVQAALGQLGEAVVADPELLAARVIAAARTGATESAQADFIALLELPDATIDRLAGAFRWLPQTARRATARPYVVRIVALADRESRVCHALSSVDADQWTPDAALLAFEEALARDWIDEAHRVLARASASLDPSDARLVAARERLDRNDAAQRSATEASAAELLATRPSMADIATLFATELPAALREAWDAAYRSEGPDLMAEFLTPPAHELSQLTDLARELVDDFPDGPAAILPFARGEHDDEYHVIDLATRDATGDCVVWVIFLRGGEGWSIYPTTRAWIDAGGVTRYP